MKQFVLNALRALGYDIVPYNQFPPDTSSLDSSIMQRIAPYTMTSPERQIALIQAVRYITRRSIPGCFVECGVWRGGSTMAAALILLQEGEMNRDLYLFDTFQGMSPPTNLDKARDGTSAQKLLQRTPRGTGVWCVADLEDVRANLKSTNYPLDRVHFIKGSVEETIPTHSPSQPIALLRLDTDWYESTKHEMKHLFPHLQEGGVLIIDDYGHWEGARLAIDEFLTKQEKYYYLHRIDDTGRLLIKH